MTDITNWTTPTGRLLRQIANAEGDPLFVAKDVCEALGLSNTSMACRKLAPDEKTTITKVDSGGIPTTYLVITEPAVYKLIARSNKPEAESFDRWVRHKVLPTIRKTGAYQARVTDEKIDARLSRLESKLQMVDDIRKQLSTLLEGRCSRETLTTIKGTAKEAAERYFEAGFFKSLAQARSKFTQQVLAACGWQGHLDDLPVHYAQRALLECRRIESSLKQFTARRQGTLQLPEPERNRET